MRGVYITKVRGWMGSSGVVDRSIGLGFSTEIVSDKSTSTHDEGRAECQRHEVHSRK